MHVRIFCMVVLAFVVCGCNGRSSELESKFAAERALLEQQIESYKREIDERKADKEKTVLELNDLAQKFMAMENLVAEKSQQYEERIESVNKDARKAYELRKELDLANEQLAKADQRVMDVAKQWQEKLDQQVERMEQASRSLRDTVKYRTSMLDRTDKRLLELAISKARKSGIVELTERDAELLAIQGTIEYVQFADEYFKANPPK